MPEPLPPEMLARLRRTVEHHRLNGGTYPVDDVDALLAEVDRLQALTAVCSCGSTYATYEGPEPECAVHGAVRALNASDAKAAQLLAEIGRQAARAHAAETERDRVARLLDDEGTARVVAAVERLRMLEAAQNHAIAAELRRLAGEIDAVADPCGDSFQHGEAAGRREVQGTLSARAAELEAEEPAPQPQPDAWPGSIPTPTTRTERVHWAESVVRDAAEQLGQLVTALGDAEQATVEAQAIGSADGGICVAGVHLPWMHLACLLDMARTVVGGRAGEEVTGG